MYVARDEVSFSNHELNLFSKKPFRQKRCWGNGGRVTFPLEDTMFPDLKWEDEPLEVVLINKIVDSESTK